MIAVSGDRFVVHYITLLTTSCMHPGYCYGPLVVKLLGVKFYAFPNVRQRNLY